MDSVTLLQNAAPLLPVIVLDTVENAVPLAEALIEGGLNAMEITLRTPCALEAISIVKNKVPECLVGAGTVVNCEQFDQVIQSGGDFIVSPGITPELSAHAGRHAIPYLPGVSSASDIMMVMSYGYNAVKFFPAEQAGGVAMLKALSGPFGHIVFCPTGGVDQQNHNHYLALENVPCTGGSWCAPRSLIRERQWRSITRLARSCHAV